MFSTNVDDEVIFHLTGVWAAGACIESAALCRMRLGHVLLQTALLNESLSTPRFCTLVRQRTGVFLHMIEHRILTRFNYTAFWANKLTRFIPNICHLDRRCHPAGE